MTRAKLIIETDDEPIVANFDVNDDEQTTTITITPTDVKIHTKSEPFVTTT